MKQKKMGEKSQLVWLSALIILIFSLSACSLPSGMTNMNAETAIAQTVAAEIGQPENGVDLPFTGTPELEEVIITVSVDTNCRAGPDAVFDKLGMLQVGETAVVIGKRTVADYWVIQNPDAPGTCWLWGMYATLHGNTDLIPEMTPPPTPTSLPPPAGVEEPGQDPAEDPTATEVPHADFSAYFSGLCNISGNTWLNIGVTNTGNVDLESAEQTVVDTTSHDILYGPGTSNKPFRATVTCTDTTLVDTLIQGTTGFLRVKLENVVSGHSVTANIMLCSEDNVVGLCVSKPVNFAIP